MTTETVIQKVRSKLGNLDEGGEQIVAAALEVLKEAEVSRPALAAEAENFSSRNISMEEFISFPRDERVHYQSAAETANQRWIERQFETLGANWIIVIDGQVVKHGASLGDYPREAEIHELQEKTGKCPFIFFSNFLLAIEEAHTRWHTTNKANDYYPRSRSEFPAMLRVSQPRRIWTLAHSNAIVI